MQHVINVSRQVPLDFEVRTEGRAVTVWVKDLDSGGSTAFVFGRPEGAADTLCECVGAFRSYDKLQAAIDKLNKEAT